LCSQSLGTNIGIIFNKNVNIAVLVAVSLTVLKIVFSNVIISVHETHYLLQWLIKFNPLNLGLDSIFYLIYGFGRCKEVSVMLFTFHLNEEDFWFNIRFLLIYFICLKLIALLILIVKANKLLFERSPENSHNLVIQTSKVEIKFTPNEVDNIKSKYGQIEPQFEEIARL